MPKIMCGMTVLNDFKKETVFSLMQTCAKDNPFDGFLVVGATLLPMARNLIIQQAYERLPDFTHLMFIDDDMTNFNADSIWRLLNHDRDVVSGLCTRRMPPYTIVHGFHDETLVPSYIDEGALVEIYQTGMAFTLIKREVLEAIEEETSDGKVWFTGDREPRVDFDKEALEFVEDHFSNDDETVIIKRKDLDKYTLEAIAFGQNSHIGSQLLGEDVSFSRKIRKLGFKIWVDCAIQLGHVGEFIGTVQENQEYCVREDIKKGKLKLVVA